jgi:cupin 2 domain-containing protein
MLASRGQLPPDAEAYRTIGPFDAETLPQGLRAEHSLKPGTWGLIELTEGSLRFVWDDAEGGTEDVVAPARLIVPPQVLHHVEGSGSFALTITFYRSADSTTGGGLPR